MSEKCKYVLNDKDLTYIGENSINNDDFKCVMNYFIGQKDAEISLSPTIVMLLSTSSSKPYKVRTLLDSGSMTNWIAKELLSKIRHTTKGHTSLEVFTMTGKMQKKFQLVEVYYDYKGQEKNLMCYVHDGFTKHITVKGLPEYIKDNSEVTQEQLENITDPATPDVDHKDVSFGIGIILCTSSMNELRTEEAVVHLKGLNILLEPTIFGTAVSGKVPQALRGNVDAVCGNYLAPSFIQNFTKPLSTKAFHVKGKINLSSLKENASVSCQ